MDATVKRLLEPKTELNTGELRSGVEEFAPNNDAGSASTEVKQETHTGSVFDTSKTYEYKAKAE
eukprot:9278820-Karenia_brevis.AAC.1